MDARGLTAVGLVAWCGMLPLGASAAAGPYVGVEGGLNLLGTESATVNSFNTGGTLTPGPGRAADLHWKNGWLGGLTFGWTHPQYGFRPEIALDWRSNLVRNATHAAAGVVTGGGRVNAVAAFANLWYDLHPRAIPEGPVHPYFGFGFGGVRENYRDVALASNPVRTLFAYQVGTGVGWNITSKLTAQIDYRYMLVNRGTFHFENAGTTANTELRYRSQSWRLGLRYSFLSPPEPAEGPVAATQVVPVAQAPEPAAAPAPAPAPACTPPDGFRVDAACHLVSQTAVLHDVTFDTDSARLTAQSRTRLDAVAGVLQAQPGVTVSVNGYTDARAGHAHNLRLSRRRAESVRAYLVAKGVADTRLSTQGLGEAHPLAGNDSEEGRAQNRRVEFVVTAPAAVTVAPAEPAGAPAAETATAPVAGPAADAAGPAPAAPGADAPPPQ